MCILFAERRNYSDYSQANRKIGTQSMRGATPHRGFYVIKVHNLVKFSAVPGGERKTVAGVLSGSLAMMGSQIREGNLNINPIRVHVLMKP
jgi:hypothetical protein